MWHILFLLKWYHKYSFLPLQPDTFWKINARSFWQEEEDRNVQRFNFTLKETCIQNNFYSSTVFILYVSFKALTSCFSAWVDLTVIPADVLNLCTEFSEPTKKKSFAKKMSLFLPIQVNVICGRNLHVETPISRSFKEMLVSGYEISFPSEISHKPDSRNTASQIDNR
jgi:hypothetical protein